MVELSASFEFVATAGAVVQLDDLIERHKALVLRTAWRMLGNLADAEDATQEIFLKLHGLKEEPATAWIYRVTVNHCLDRIRRRKPEADVTVLEVMPARERDPEQALELKQKQERLARMIARLPERERACLVLRDLEGLSGAQVAAILDCSEETVRTAIFRAKEKLRQWMS